MSQQWRPDRTTADGLRSLLRSWFLGVGAALTLVGYLVGRCRWGVQQGAHHGLELVFGHFNGFGHGFIVRHHNHGDMI